MNIIEHIQSNGSLSEGGVRLLFCSTVLHTIAEVQVEDSKQVGRIMDLSKFNLGSYIPAMPYVVRELFDKATNIVMNYTDTEAKVVEATNDESWGPSGTLLQDLSQLSFSSENYNEVRLELFEIR